MSGFQKGRVTVAILVKCRCGERFQTNEANAGRSANCPDCGRELVIPIPRQGSLGRVEGAGVLTSGKAIWSVFLGVSSLLLAAITGIPAILLGLKAIADINRDRGLTGGRGIATTGIALGLFGSTVLSIVYVIPAIEAIRESVRYQSCVNHMKLIGLAFHQAQGARGTFPTAAILSKDGQPLLSWRVALLAHMGPGEKHLYGQFHLDEPWDSPHNLKLVSQMPNVYLTADRPTKRPGETFYQVVTGKNTMFPGAQGVSFGDVTDGTSATIMVVEAANPVIWTKPADITAMSISNPVPTLPNRASPRSKPAIPFIGITGVGGIHNGGFCALFVDGSVHWIDQAITTADFMALITRNGGELPSLIY